jgi:hypothetical protein
VAAILATVLCGAMLVVAAPSAHADGACGLAAPPIGESLDLVGESYATAEERIRNYLENEPATVLGLTPDVRGEFPHVNPDLVSVRDWYCHYAEIKYATGSLAQALHLGFDLQVEAPDLRGMTGEDARRILLERGIGVAVTQTHVQPDWLIGGQDVPPGDVIAWDVEQMPTVGITFEAPVVVPDLSHRRPEEAGDILIAEGLTEGVWHGQGDRSGVRVIRQRPTAGAKVLRGTPIDIWLDVVAPPAPRQSTPTVSPAPVAPTGAVQPSAPTDQGRTDDQFLLSAEQGALLTVLGTGVLLLIFLIVVLARLAARPRQPAPPLHLRPRSQTRQPPSVPPQVVALAHIPAPRTWLEIDAQPPARTVHLVAHADPGTQTLEEVSG